MRSDTDVTSRWTGAVHTRLQVCGRSVGACVYAVYLQVCSNAQTHGSCCTGMASMAIHQLTS